MFILYFDHTHHEYYHGAMAGWFGYDNFRAGEGFWMVPGTDPEDCFYVWER